MEQHVKEKVIPMPKVTAETLEAIHVKAARGLLEFSTKDLAALLTQEGNPHMRLRNFEAGRAAPLALRQQLIEVFERCGLELLNGGNPGVRVSNPKAFEAAKSNESPWTW